MDIVQKMWDEVAARTKALLGRARAAAREAAETYRKKEVELRQTDVAGKFSEEVAATMEAAIEILEGEWNRRDVTVVTTAVSGHWKMEFELTIRKLATVFWMARDTTTMFSDANDPRITSRMEVLDRSFAFRHTLGTTDVGRVLYDMLLTLQWAAVYVANSAMAARSKSRG